MPRLTKKDKDHLRIFRGLYSPASSPKWKKGQTVYWRNGRVAGKIIEIRKGGSGIALSGKGVRAIGNQSLKFAIRSKDGVAFGASKDIMSKPKKKRRR